MDYLTSTFAERETHRARRWKAAMEIGGVRDYWTYAVPRNTGESYPFEDGFGPETQNMTRLRSYVWSNDVPPIQVIWSFPRWAICASHRDMGDSVEDGRGLDTLGCEPVLDWAIWAVEQLVESDAVAWSFPTEIQYLAEDKLAIELGALLRSPRTALDVYNIGIGESANLWAPLAVAISWLDSSDSGGSIIGLRDDNFAAVFSATESVAEDVKAGNKPWESVP